MHFEIIFHVKLWWNKFDVVDVFVFFYTWWKLKKFNLEQTQSEW